MYNCFTGTPERPLMEGLGGGINKIIKNCCQVSKRRCLLIALASLLGEEGFFFSPTPS